MFTKVNLTQNCITPTHCQFFIHPSVSRASHWTLSMKFVVKGLLSHLASLNTMKGFNVVPSHFPVRQTETRTLMCSVDFMGTTFEPVFSTEVLETISFQTGVLSIAKMLASWKLNCFWIRQTCITYAMIQSTIYDGFFWEVAVFLLGENPCLHINFSHTTSTTSNKGIFDDRIIKNAFGLSHNHFSTDMEDLASFPIDPVC